MKINWLFLSGYSVIILAFCALFKLGDSGHMLYYIIGFILLILMGTWRSIYTGMLTGYLRKNGVKSTATLIRAYSLWAFGPSKRPLMRITLTVHGAAGQSWPATIYKEIYPEYLYTMQPGTVLDVFYNTKDPSNVVLA
ncbi:MAG: hypothetical protein ACXVJD_15760 [Mucilaginibacter sp.]